MSNRNENNKNINGEIRLRKGIEKAISKYKCLQEEFFFIENTMSYVCINWHKHNDRYVSMQKVIWIATFLRKYTDKPIYCGYGRVDV